MNKFENQIHRAAQRMKEKSNSKIKPAPNPRKSTRPTWGWISTPVAAAVGLIAGMIIPTLFTEKESINNTAQDTSKTTHHAPVDTMGKNVLNDGIAYNMFVVY